MILALLLKNCCEKDNMTKLPLIDKIRAISPTAMSAKIPWYWKFERLFTNIVDWIMVYVFRRGKNMIRIKSLGINEYADKDWLMFHVAFQLLVNYVEDELAWMHSIARGKTRMRYHWFKIPLAKEWGLAHLEWEIQQGDDSPSQSEAAKEIKELYLWFKETRPNRPDLWDLVPYRPLEFEPMENGAYRMVLPDDEEYKTTSQAAWDADEAYVEEDTEMLCRLMRVRRALWT